MFPSGGPIVRFLTRYNGEVSEPLVGAREVGSPCEWRGGARQCSRAMGGDSGLETCCRRSLEVFPGLRQDTLGSLDLCR